MTPGLQSKSAFVWYDKVWRYFTQSLRGCVHDDGVCYQRSSLDGGASYRKFGLLMPQIRLIGWKTSGERTQLKRRNCSNLLMTPDMQTGTPLSFLLDFLIFLSIWTICDRGARDDSHNCLIRVILPSVWQPFARPAVHRRRFTKTSSRGQRMKLKSICRRLSECLSWMSKFLTPLRCGSRSIIKLSKAY